MISNIQAARSLGWLSLAVGATEIVATRWVQDEIGVRGQAALIRSFGMREIAAGVTILGQPGLNRTLVGALWARVFGDAVDLILLRLADRTTRDPGGLATITGIVLAAMGLDIAVAAGAQRNLHHAASVSRAARNRVRPTKAIPDGNGSAKSRTAMREQVSAEV